MSQHSVEELEEREDASAPKDRYRAELRWRGRGWWEVQLVTVHTIRSMPDKDPVERESLLPAPYVVLGRRWAEWKGRRIVAAAKARDVREQQPWTTGA